MTSINNLSLFLGNYSFNNSAIILQLCMMLLVVEKWHTSPLVASRIVFRSFNTAYTYLKQYLLLNKEYFAINLKYATVQKFGVGIKF